MTHLKFNQEFCFTVSVSNHEADQIMLALNASKFIVQHEINIHAPALTDITILCQKGINDAVKAVSILNS